MPHRPPSCGDSAPFPLLSHLQRPNCSSSVLVTLILSVTGLELLPELGTEDFPAPGKASVTGAPSGPLRVGAPATEPFLCIISGHTLEQHLLAQFYRKSLLVTVFLLLVLFFFLQKNSIEKPNINRTLIKTSVVVFLPPLCTQFLLQ